MEKRELGYGEKGEKNKLGYGEKGKFYNKYYGKTGIFHLGNNHFNFCSNLS